MTLAFLNQKLVWEEQFCLLNPKARSKCQPRIELNDIYVSWLLYSFSSAKECVIKRIYIFNSILECFMFIILFICVLLHLLYFLILNWQTKYSTSLFTLMIIIFVFRCYFADRPTQIVLLTTRTTKN